MDAVQSGFAVFGRAAAAFKKDVVLVRVVVCLCVCVRGAFEQ